VVAASAAVVSSLAGPHHAAGSTAFVTAGNDVQYVGNGFANRVLVTTEGPVRGERRAGRCRHGHRALRLSNAGVAVDMDGAADEGRLGKDLDNC
jgi:hypothetical protein